MRRYWGLRMVSWRSIPESHLGYGKFYVLHTHIHAGANFEHFIYASFLQCVHFHFEFMLPSFFRTGMVYPYAPNLFFDIQSCHFDSSGCSAGGLWNFKQELSWCIRRLVLPDSQRTGSYSVGYSFIVIQMILKVLFRSMSTLFIWQLLSQIRAVVFDHRPIKGGVWDPQCVCVATRNWY